MLIALRVMLQIDLIIYYIDAMHITGIDLNLLTAFEALMLDRSVSRAAARLGIGQPAASHALNRLRVLFDDELLVRHGRLMVPTPRALALADPVGRALAAAREALEPARPWHPATAERSFTISGGDYAVSTILPRLIGPLRATAPGVNLRVRFIEKDRIEELMDDGTLDLALGVFPNAAKRFQTTLVCDDHFVCVARREHPAFGARLTLHGFVTAMHILVTERGDEHGVVDAALAQRGLARRIALTVPSVLAVRRLLLGSDMIATIGNRVAQTFAEDKRLAVAALPIEMPAWHLQLLQRRQSRPDAGIAWLSDQILQAASRAAV
jgi:DNA-binding transcriptional LysR family regulator